MRITHAAFAVLLIVLSGYAVAASPPALTASGPGLVAAYSFNEKTGLKARDASRNHNVAMLRNARRVAKGRFGRAIAFNGRNSWVTAPDTKQLSLSKTFTVMAWVKPTMRSGWRAVVTKETKGAASYSLYAHTPSGFPSAEGKFGKGGARAAGGETLPTGKWTHLAMTYDGSQVRLYRNGQQVGAEAASGLTFNGRGPLRIGGNSVWGEWFRGVIDEVRIYSRALDPVEVRSDLTAPVPTASGKTRPAAGGGGPTPAPAPAIGPRVRSAPGPFAFGVVSTRDLTQISEVQTKFGAGVTRIEFGIDTSTADMRGFIGRAADNRVEPVLLAGFPDGGLPSSSQAAKLGDWAREFGPGGTFWNGRSGGQYAVRFIEFGNESSYEYKGTSDQGGDYARRAKDAFNAIQAANPRVGLLIEADDANKNSPAWVNSMFAAVPDIANIAAGWTIHPYGRREKWEPRIQRVIDQTQARGAPSNIPIFMTEWGLATDDGNSLSDNYGWPTNMTYAQAGQALRDTVTQMDARFPGRLAMLLYYRTRDHAPRGASSAREEYFGLLKVDQSDKGDLTEAARDMAARFPVR